MRTITASLVLAATLVAAAAGLRIEPPVAAQAPPAPALPSVPKFAVARSPIQLTGDARPRQYLGVVGPQAAWLGTETGEAEIWAHPLKLVANFRLDFQLADSPDPVRGADVARTVDVRPELTTITYTHQSFTVRQHVLAPLDRPGVLVLLDVDAIRPIEIVASFRNVFQYAWPAAFGGQYASWQPEQRAYLLSESLRRRNGYLGSPWATGGSSAPAHALPDTPSTFRIPVDLARARQEFIPIAIVGGTATREATADAYRALIADAQALYRARVAHADALRTAAVSIDTPDDRLDLALEWAKVDLDEQRVCNPDLGCGLVAGWGPSGQGTRPGFGWFFGGDSAINSLAMSSAGLSAPVAEMLRFFAKYQRADGKITHEISQSAAQIPWFTDFPYAYYHADTTPYWIAAVWQHWRATGDRALLDELWPAVRKAWAWCLTTETDGDGLVENTSGGLGAIEVGEIGEAIHQDVYLAAVWLLATEAMQEMATARGEAQLAGEARGLREKGGRTLNEQYWIEAAGHHAFGLLTSRRTNDALTVWPATAAAFGLLDAPRASRTLAAMASHRLTADWGTRMLASDHKLYDPLHYNMGAVWPFVTGFVALGHYRYERPWAAFPLVDAVARQTFDFARGRHAELYSGAFYRPLDEAVPHQFFATSMLVSPLLRGVAGWTADAPRGAARLAPQPPPSWDTFTVRGLPSGGARVEARIAQSAGRVVATLHSAGGPLDVQYVPPVPAGARDVRTVPAGATVRLGSTPVTVTTTWRGGYAVAPPAAPHAPGARSEGLRVLDVVAEGAEVRIVLEATAGSQHALEVFGPRPAAVAGAEPDEWRGDRGRLRLRFPSTGGDYARLVVTVRQP